MQRKKLKKNFLKKELRLPAWNLHCVSNPMTMSTLGDYFFIDSALAQDCEFPQKQRTRKKEKISIKI
jgi:hypothetical protein